MSLTTIYPGSNPELLLSVIVPVHNEAQVLGEFNRRLAIVLDNLPVKSEVIYIDDGSTDNSVKILRKLSFIKAEKSVIKLSRNFGKEAAMCAGLSKCNGDAVIFLDADLQDPPELIPSMIIKWRHGFDVVNMQRRTRAGENWFKKFSAQMFYKIINQLSDTNIPENVGDFRLISRRVVNELLKLPERNLYMKGLFAWPGFKQTIIQFDREPRWSGSTKWNYPKLIGLAIDGITSFSTKPLQFATWFGAITAIAAFVYGGVVVAKTLIFGEAVAGYPSLMVVVLTLGGINLLAIGIVGSYIGRIFQEVKARPNFIIQDFERKADSKPSDLAKLVQLIKEQ